MELVEFHLTTKREAVILQCKGTPPMQEVSARPLYVCTTSNGQMIKAPLKHCMVLGCRAVVPWNRYLHHACSTSQRETERCVGDDR